MPEMIHYVVTQTRRVRVTANSETGAAIIATKAFEEGEVNHKNPATPTWGHTNSPVSVTELNIARGR